ncbi:MAG: trypsin-like serine protease [Myxococcales bacterium]|nr:trypsin-like serine protease [Myxococcales bacterium]
MQLVGFGATSRTNPSTAGVLRLVDRTSVSCSFVGLSDASLICWSQTNGRGKCEGDSGGPSFAMIEPELAQVGIASFADQQCAQLGADTRIAAETAFLYEHVPELQCAADGTCGAACGQGALPADPDCGCDAAHPAPTATSASRGVIVAPFAPGGVGSECADGTDCQSGVCAASGDQSLCVLAVHRRRRRRVPSGFDAAARRRGGGGVCWPSDDSGGCCSTGGGGGAATSLVGLASWRSVCRRRR